MGGGAVALAKLQALRGSGAWVRVVSLRFNRAFLEETKGHAIELRERAFTAGDLDDIHLVISATNDARANALIAHEARLRGLWVNAVDDPDRCDAFFASTLRRGPYTLAIGTEGRFPGLSRSLRLSLESLLPQGDGELLLQLAAFRNRIRRQLPDPRARSAALHQLLHTFEATYFPSAEVGAPHVQN